MSMLLVIHLPCIDGLFDRIIGKIGTLTILQYINYKNNNLWEELNMR